MTRLTTAKTSGPKHGLRARMRRAACVFLSVCLTSIPLIPVLAQTATTAPAPSSPASGAAGSTANLNLSSVKKTETADVAGTIKVGTKQVTFGVGDFVTPAQNLALSQIAGGGTQSIVLGALGNAVGGTFNLTGNSATGTLVIPRGVTGLGDFTASTLNLTGNLSNSGSLYIFSTDPSAATAAINANNIYNNRGGLLSTLLPTNNPFGITNAIGMLNLNLSAINDIINAGIIRSSGSLTMTAGNSIINALPAGVTGPSPLMQAATSLNFNANNIVNSGIMAALAGNINIAGATLDSIKFNNTNGTLQALLGSINVRDALFDAKSNFNLSGGRLLSEQLNIFSGTGVSNLNAKEISGLVNITAGEAHVTVNDGTLSLGNIDLSGDPTFYNTAGNVEIGTNLIFDGEALAIVAKGDILTTASNLQIDTRETGGLNAGTITLIAGAKFTTSDASLSGNNNTLTTLTITGSSTTGGKIDLNTNPITMFDASSTTGNGGDIIMVAYKGSGAGSGTITLPTAVTIDASATAGNTAGNVTIVGGATTGTAITLGGIDAAGGATLGGNINLFSATPKIVGNTVVQITDGVVNPLFGTYGAGTTTAGNITVGSATKTLLAANALNVTSNGIFTANGNITTGGSVTINALASGTSAITSGDDITITTKGNIVSVGVMNAVDDITLKTTANNGSIIFNRNVIAGDAVVMQANGKGAIRGLNQSLGNFGSILVASPLVDFEYVQGAAVNPDGTRLYVPVYGQPNVVIYDLTTATPTIVTTVNVGADPQSVVVSPDGSRVYVAISSGSTVAVIDTGTNTTLPSIPVVGGKAEQVAISPDGAFLYVLAMNVAGIGPPGPGTFNIIDLSDNSTTTLAVGTSIKQTGSVVVNAAGTLAYVTATGTKQVFAIDLTNNTIKATIDLSNLGSVAPYSLAIDPTGTKLYVAEANRDGSGFITGLIAVIDSSPVSANFNKVIATVGLPQPVTPTANFGSFPQGLSVNKTGTEVFAQSTYLPNMSGILTVNSQFFEFLNVGTGPDGLGSSSFSTVTTVGGVPNETTFTSNTQNVSGAANNLTQVQKPTIQGNSISLSSTGGDIIANYDVRGGTFTANTGGGAILGNVGALDSTIGASKAGSIFQLGSLNGLTVAGAIVAPTLQLFTTTGNSGITLNASVGKTGGTTFLHTAGTGDMVQGVPTAKIIGTNVTLTSDGGVLGSFDDSGAAVIDNRLQTTATNLNINTGGGAAVNNSTALTLKTSIAGGQLMVSSQGKLTLPKGSSLDSPDIYLRTNAGSKGSVSLNGQVGFSNAPGTKARVSADSTGSITQGAGTYNIMAESVLIDFETAHTPEDTTQPFPSGNAGSSSSPLRLDADSLGVLSLGGSQYFKNDGSLDLSFSTINKNFSVTVVDGDLTVSGGLVNLGSSLSSNITLQTTGTVGNRDIILNTAGVIGYDPDLFIVPGQPLVQGANVKVISAGSIINQMGTGNGIIRGRNVTLQAAGEIGTSNLSTFYDELVSTAALFLTVKAGGTAHVDVEGFASFPGIQVPVFLQASSATGTADPVADFQLLSFRPVTISKALVAQDVDLEIYGGQIGNITLSANVGTTGAGSTKISADGPNNIFWTAGTILSPTVVIGGMDTGSIGTASKPVKTTATTLIGGTLQGSTYISNVGDLDLYAGTQINPAVPTDVGSIYSVTNKGNLNVMAGNPISVAASRETAGTGNGIIKAFAFTITPSATKNLKVFINGVQQATTAYKVDLTNHVITFTTAPANLDTIEVANAEGSQVSLKTTTIGSINIGDDVTAAPNADSAAKITISTAGTGALTTTGGSVITAPAVSLTTNAGNLTATTDTTNLLATILTGTSGSVDVDNMNAGTLLLNKAVTGANYDVTTAGALTVNGIANRLASSATTGFMNVTAGGGALTVAGSLTMKGGGIDIQQALGGTIVFNQNVKVTTMITAANKGTPATSPANINIFVGPGGTSESTFPSAIVITESRGGVVHEGTAGGVVFGGTGTDKANVTAAGADVTFDSAAGGITINKGVLIKADPPAPGALSTTPVKPMTSPTSKISITPSQATNVAEPQAITANVPVIDFGAAITPLDTTPQAVNSSKVKVITGGVEILKQRKQDAVVRTGDVEHLAEGRSLLAPDEDVTFATPFGDLTVAAKSIVLAVLTERGMALYNLHDEHRGDVALGKGERQMNLDVGRHILITRSGDSYEALNPLEYVAHRNMKSTEFGEGMTAFSSEFSITSAIGGTGPLSSMLRSDNADEKRIMNRLLKDAAIIMQTRSADGLYKRLAPGKLSWEAAQ